MTESDSATPLELPANDHHRDPWLWCAHLDNLADPDHETVDEFDPDTDRHRRLSEVDFSRLVLLHLVSQRPDTLPDHFLTLPAGSTPRPILFRRYVANVPMSEGPDGDEAGATRLPECITVLGWQDTLTGHDGQPLNVQSFTFLTEDGQVVVSNDRDALDFGPDDVPTLHTPTYPRP